MDLGTCPAGLAAISPRAYASVVTKLTSKAIERTLLGLVAARTGKTVCPSEVARALAPTDFRKLMPAVRRAAQKLCERGLVVATQRGKVINPVTARGPIRLGAPNNARSTSSPTRQRAQQGTSRYQGIDFRAHPEAYRVGRGEQGVLSAEPYKSELLPLWRFRTVEVARQSAAALWRAFVCYRRASDFVGMDMTRKFLQMGFTRARRYANHSSGLKYAADGTLLPPQEDAAKASAASIFREQWQRADQDPTYRAWRELQRKRKR